MWTIIVIVLICLLLLLILLLCIPLSISLKAVATDSLVCSFRITWLFGLIKGDISAGKKSLREQHTGGKRPGISRFPLSEILNANLLHQVYILLKRLISHIKIRRLDIDLRIGLDDPADTWAFAAAALWTTLFAHPPFPHTISIQPRFTDEFLIDGTASTEVLLIPITIIVATGRFALSSPVLKLTARTVQARWKRKRYV